MKKLAKCCLVLLILFFILILGVSIFVAVTIAKIPDKTSLDLSSISVYNSQYQIFGAGGEHISSNASSGRQTVDLATLPDYVPSAFVSIEDKTFFEHNGINLGRIIKAGVKNMFCGYAKEGASTITQQLVKNIFLSNEKTLSRKIQEAYLALQLERQYSKEEILQTYLNAIYFGNGAFGIQSAAQNYFGCDAQDLTLDQAAVLAGLIKSPKTYSPILNPEKCRDRRDLVLKNMLDDAKISLQSYESALAQNICVDQAFSRQNDAIECVLREAETILDRSERDISSSGYKIYTSLNTELQSVLDSEKSTDKENASLIIDNKTGGIIATFGDINLPRQPASTIKPFLCYAPHLERGTLSPATPILDAPVTFGDYTPRNANDSYLGFVDMRTALSQSTNIPAIKALSCGDMEYSTTLARQCGFCLTDHDKNLAVALGATSKGTPIRDVASAYSMLGNLGIKNNVGLIQKIVDSQGDTIYLAPHTQQRILSAETAYLLTDMLKTCVKMGTAKKLNILGLDNLAAKTGTAGTSSHQTNSDAWCVSFTPQFTVLTWFGNTTGDPDLNLTKSENGGTIAARQSLRIWQHLAKFFTLEGDFSRPDNVRTVTLDSRSLDVQKLEIASENTPQRYTKTEIFNSKFAPTEVSQNFCTITVPQTALTLDQGKLRLSWDGQDLYNYRVYAKTGQKNKLVATLSGVDDDMSFAFEKPKKSTQYYLVVSLKIDPTICAETAPQKYLGSTRTEI